MDSQDFGASFEDFFNLDMLGGPSTASTSSMTSGSPTSSPEVGMPPTPPQPMEPSLFSFDTSPSDFNLFGIDPSATLAFPPLDKDTLSMPSTYDLFGQGSSSTSPSSFISSSPSTTVDPQLVGSPSAHEEAEEEEEEEEAEEVEEEENMVPTVKAGGKGLSKRRGTIVSGGITKKVAKEPKLKLIEEDLDDWRPSPEEYKKMTSKEKRQLRNKISARNFRIRRKEYINTLEGDIEERDNLIDTIRRQLGQSQDENSALRQEVEALKKMIMDGRANPVLPPPAPLSPISPVLAAAAVANRPSTTLNTVNTQKDLPTSPRAGSAFWGGVGAGGITPVHTTLVPDVSLNLSGKLAENLNPQLNSVNGTFSNASGPFPSGPSPFDSFADTNPFTLKTLDAYRMQLWGKLAAAQNITASQQQPIAPQPRKELTGLAANLKPAYFSESSNKEKAEKPASTSVTALSSMLANKCIVTPKSQVRGNGAPQEDRRAAAAVADIMSSTLLSKLGNAFWDAFAVSPSYSPSRNQKEVRPWDAEKVRRVLEGTAVLQVVEVEKPKAKPAPMVTNVNVLEERMRNLALSGACKSASQKPCGLTDSVFGQICPTAIASAKASKAASV